MAYRDDVEALKQRLDEAERENADLRTENEALRRGIAPKIVDAGRVLGLRTRLRIERTFHGELPASTHAEIARRVRAVLGVKGSAISLGKTLVVRTRSQREARAFELRVTAKDGRTTITVDEKLGQLAGGLLGGIGGGLGLGGLGGVVALVHAVTDPIVTALAAPLWILGALGVARALYGAIAQRRQARHVELVQELGAVVQAALDAQRPPTTARVRVAEGPAAEGRDGDAEDDARLDAGRASTKL